MLTKKIWCPAIESEPTGLFNRETCPDVPENWFREKPEVAAELWFRTTTSRELVAHVVQAL